MQPAAAATPLPQRVLHTFVAPRRLFRELRKHPAWLGPLLIVVAVALLVAALTPASVLLERMRDPVDRLGRPVTVTSPAAEVVRWGRVLQVFSALVMEPLVILLLAGTLAVIFSGLLRGEARFPHYLAVTCHALLIPTAGSLLVLVLAGITGTAGAGITLARVLPLAPPGPVWNFLDAVNPFTLWGLVVAALGVSVINRNVSRARAAGLLVGGYLGLALALALFA